MRIRWGASKFGDSQTPSLALRFQTVVLDKSIIMQRVIRLESVFENKLLNLAGTIVFSISNACDCGDNYGDDCGDGVVRSWRGRMK